MKCRNCDAPKMTVRRESYRYAESGLPNVTLLDIDVYHCERCGERVPSIPRLVELHRVIALALAAKPTKLTPAEIRYLRKHLGLSRTEFAEAVGVDPATVSRWESDREPQQVGLQAERLIRMMIVARDSEEDFSAEKLATTARKDAAPARLGFRPGTNGWNQSDSMTPV